MGEVMYEIANNQAKDRRASTFWVHEAVTYLGLDRLGLARPEKAIYRLINKGALPTRKISGHFVFSKADLDRLLANGDQKRGRGRPRKMPGGIMR